MRLLLGGVAAALALAVVPQSASAETVECAEGFEAVCVAYWIAQSAACHPKYNPC